MTSRSRATSLTASASLLFALSVWVTPVLAQDAQPPAAPATQDAGNAAPTAPIDPARAVTVFQLVNNLNRSGDIVVLADRSVAQEQAMPIDTPVRAENIEQTLTQVARSLPAGTVWAKVYLPAESGKASAARWNADAVGDYILAQSRLFGTVGGPTPNGTIEIMGKKLSGKEANNVTSALNLKPVYILINPNRRINQNGQNGQTAPAAPAVPDTQAAPATAAPEAPATAPATPPTGTP